MQKKKIFIVMMLTVFCFGILTAGDLEENLSVMLANNAKMYVQPLVTGFGSSMNSGLYKRAKCTTGKLPLPIGFDVNIIVSASLVPDEDLNYDYYFMDNTIDFDLQSIDASLPNVTISMSDLYTADKDETPTISGDEEGAVMTLRTQAEAPEFSTYTTDVYYNGLVDCRIVFTDVSYSKYPFLSNYKQKI